MVKSYVKWASVEEYVDNIVDHYKGKGLTGVYGLPRGGLVIAVMVSHRLGIPMLMSPIQDCLIVDDICDSGESLIHYYENSSAFAKPLYHITTMYYKDGAKVTPEYYMFNKKDRWIVFPWEEKEPEGGLMKCTM